MHALLSELAGTSIVSRHYARPLDLITPLSYDAIVASCRWRKIHGGKAVLWLIVIVLLVLLLLGGGGMFWRAR
jgi:hypothetical protein